MSGYKTGKLSPQRIRTRPHTRSRCFWRRSHRSLSVERHDAATSDFPGGRRRDRLASIAGRALVDSSNWRAAMPNIAATSVSAAARASESGDAWRAWLALSSPRLPMEALHSHPRQGVQFRRGLHYGLPVWSQATSTAGSESLTSRSKTLITGPHVHVATTSLRSLNAHVRTGARAQCVREAFQKRSADLSSGRNAFGTVSNQIWAAQNVLGTVSTSNCSSEATTARRLASDVPASQNVLR
jgi:hypothetical protein